MKRKRLTQVFPFYFLSVNGKGKTVLFRNAENKQKSFVKKHRLHRLIDKTSFPYYNQSK